MEEAKNGRITEEMRIISKNEGVSPNFIMRGVAEGKIVILRNLERENVIPIGIGKGLRTKINANIGTSSAVSDLNLEIRKAKIAVKYGADTIMDLSTSGDLDRIRREIIRRIKVPLGTVPIYQAAIESIKRQGAIVDMDEDLLFRTIEKHAKDGVDFMTLHCGVTKDAVYRLTKHKRLTGVVSRGGTFIIAWILHNGKENPLFSNFDYILEMAKDYDFTISLGDGLRPGSIFDASDPLQIQELLTIGDLVERARKANIQTMVEGPGHLPLNHVEWNVKLEKAICKDAPFYILGPVVMEIAPGYDHIVGAIGGAIAGMAGADFLCYLTPSEHLALPSLKDVKEGVIATKIAAHAADIVKLGPKAATKDLEMAKARYDLDWNKQFSLAIDPIKAKKYRSRTATEQTETCSMCGKYCAIKILKEALDMKAVCF